MEESNDQVKAKLQTVEAFTPMRKFLGAKKDFDKGEYIPGLGLASLAMINLPSDFSDVISSAKEIKSYLQGKTPNFSYEYEKAQHPFSFFRKTILHKPLEWLKDKKPELVEKILDTDKTFAETKAGKKLLEYFNVKYKGLCETKIPNIGHSVEDPLFVKARKYSGNKFGELTARAMNRTTVIGLGLLAFCELPTIIKSTKRR